MPQATAAPTLVSTPGKRALVIGASSGIGAALVEELVRRGYAVGAVARRASELQALASRAGGKVVIRAHDVSRFAEVPALFEDLVRELGGLDLVVFAAGIMPEVERHEYDSEKDLAMLAINFGGCVAWCNEAAKLFRTQRSGTLIGISSIAGERGRKGNPMYGATKAAMNHYLEALRNRLAEVGVVVTTIKPGFIDTVMTRGKKTFWLIGPDECARQILAKAAKKKGETFVPSRWWFVGFVVRWIPSAIFRHMNF
ncbi:MAG: SDR family NAD(P)-dependent oxidoreductase [Planctomycetes bacterium]|nr:SDR family NAD(P)-dependent oxidoreductase [Planctomycetota bacterium]